MLKNGNPEQLIIAASQKVKEKNYWLERLADFPGKTCFPYNFKSTGAPRYRTVSCEWTGDLFQRLSNLSNKSDVRLFMILASGLVALLNKYTQKTDIVIGAPVYKQETERELINTVLVLRSTFPQTASFKELLMQVRQALVEAVEHYSYPISVLEQQLELPRGESQELFDTAILLENIHDPADIGQAAPNILFSFKKTPDALCVTLRYNELLFSQETADRLLSHFHAALGAAMADVNCALPGIDLVSETEKKQLLYDFNDSRADYPMDKTIVDLFQEQVERTPGNIALSIEEDAAAGTMGKITLTYAQLNREANRIARLLSQRDDSPVPIVALLGDRSPGLVAAMLAILKTGKAYMPIDPGYPVERAVYMLKDSGVHTMITIGMDEVDDAFLSLPLQMIPGDPDAGDDAEYPNPAIGCEPSGPAYIIYTSGTTGKPKGVIVEHRNVVRLLFNSRFQFDFHAGDVWTMFHSPCFDFSVWEMYGALLYGGHLVLVPRMVAREPRLYLELLKEHRVTVLNQTPSAFYNLIWEELKEQGDRLCLRYVIFGGEALQPLKLEDWRKKYPHTRLINMFGITETTVHVTFREIDAHDIRHNISNIGKPIPTLSTYIMDDQLKLSPVGIPGELFVGGDGVARGYLNRPQLTSERFFQNPHKPGEPLYRSGDLAVIDASGDMEYLGRIDHQVQLKGFRIELGEIEDRLLNLDAVKDAVVLKIDNEEDESYLCAYIVSNDPPPIAQLREHLSRAVPDYMIPAHFVFLDKLPLTSNNKLDRKALPLPHAQSGDEYVEPRTETEKQLAAVWANVLNVEQAGLNDNYFHLGGDSIKAIKLLYAVNKEFNADIKIPDLYNNETLEKLAAFLDDNQTGAVDIHIQIQDIFREFEVLKQEVVDSNVEDVYPMSDVEKGMIFTSRVDSGEAVFHDQFLYPLTYPGFEAGRFEKAMELMVQKHHILRTGFNLADYSEEVQIVFRTISLAFKYENIEKMDRDQQEAHIMDYMASSRANPFDIANPPLWRLSVFQTGPQDIVIVWEFHHAIMDGWSNASLMTELHNTYMKLGTESAYVPEPLKNSYKTFVAEQIAEKRNHSTLEFWRGELDGAQPLDLPGIFGKTHAPGKMKSRAIPLAHGMLDELKAVARDRGTSVKHICFGAYAFMLNMLNFQSGIVVGIVTNNRPICEDGGKIIGCFLNTLPVRLDIPRGLRWREYFEFVENKLNRIKNYERLSLFQIQNSLGIKAGGQASLFDTLFNYVDFHVYNQAEAGASGARPDRYQSLDGYENNDATLDLTVSTTFDNFEISVSYDHSIIDDSNLERLIGYFRRALEHAIHSPDRLCGKESLIPEEEKENLLHVFNRPAQDVPGELQEQTIHQRFAGQCQRTPGSIAVVCAERTLTYQELHRQASALASVLVSRGIQRGDIVGIMTGRSYRVPVGILAVLMAGAAYLPIDPDFPAGRAAFLLEDSGSRMLLTEARIQEDLLARGPIPVPTLDIDEHANGDNRFTGVENTSSDIVYVIYTSGSTGKPKGVMLTHANLVNYVGWFTNCTGLTHEDRGILTSSFAFDLGYTALYPTLLNGCQLHIIEKDLYLSPDALLDYIYTNRISYLKLTPSLFTTLVNSPQFTTRLGESLRLVLLGGEAIQADDVEAAHQTCPSIRFMNHYGPTEATIGCVTQWIDFHRFEDFKALPTIGRPIYNAGVYILDRNLDLLPVGVPGEMFLSGGCLARGYLNRPLLNLERFLPNPHNQGEPIYRTGDLARYLPDGRIQFLGRIDTQVKIRGYRIELSEIQSVLLQDKRIADAAVIDREDDRGIKYLCAYIVSQESIETAELRERLSAHLPEYMIPGYFVPLEKIPVTPNGKLDRRALPLPEVTAGEGYKAPSGHMEQTLAAIWSDVLQLGIENIGVEDSYFQLGGHSLNATRMAAKVHKEFNVNVPLAVFFKDPTITGLTHYLQNTAQDPFVSLEAAAEQEVYPLSSGQKRLYLMHHMETGSTGYNVPQVIRLDNIDVDRERMEHAFKALVERHESLRTSFEMKDEHPVQRVHAVEDIQFSVSYFDTHEEHLPRVMAGFVKPFALDTAPLLRIGLVSLQSGGHILLADIHHIVSDARSRQVLTANFLALYNGGTLPPLRLQYKDYVMWQQNNARGTVIEKQEQFWLSQFAEPVPPLDLPLDFPRPAVKSYDGGHLIFKVDSEKTITLRELAKKENTTLFIIMLAAFNILLSKLSGREDIVVGSPVEGRRHADLQEIIGIFVNMLALKNSPAPGKQFLEFTREVKANTLDAFENQDYQFEDLADKLNIKRNRARNPLFDIVFTLQEDENAGAGRPGQAQGNVQDNVQDHVQDNSPLPGFASVQFDMIVTGIDSGDNLQFIFEYAVKLFKEETVERYTRYFDRILAGLVENPSVTIGELDVIDNLLSAEKALPDIDFDL